MRALRKLNPGEKGTKKFMARYSEPLFCVRYRYDVVQRKRFTNVASDKRTASGIRRSGCGRCGTTSGSAVSVDYELKRS